MRPALTLVLLGWSWLLLRAVLDTWRMPWSRFFLLCLAAGLLVEAWIVFSIVAYRRYRRPLQNVWLALAASVLALLLPDLALNRLRDTHRYAVIDADSVLHHRLRPETVSVMRSNEFRAEITTNSLGLRGSEPRAQPTRTVVLLGDSFTQGEGVSQQQSFASLLEDRLARALEQPVQVINGGTDSYAPILSYLLYRDVLRDLRPDLVVLSLDMSDLLQEQYYRSLAILGPDGEPHAVPSRRLQGDVTVAIEDGIARHLYILRYLFLKVRDTVNGGAPENMEDVIARQTGGLLQHTLAGDSVDREEQWRDLFDSVLRLDRLCRADGAGFMLAIYPWGHQVNDREWVPGRFHWMPESARVSEASRETVQSLCRRNGIELIDAFPDFRRYQGDEPLYFRYDMHFTPSGHVVMADALEGSILGHMRERLGSGEGNSASEGQEP